MTVHEENNICGYRYIVLLSCFIIVVLTGGVGYGNVSIYHSYWVETFHEDNAKISTIGSLSIGLCSLFGPLASVLSNMIGLRRAIIVGGLLSTAGMMVGAFAPSVNILLVSYGVVTGAAWCISYIPGFVAATYYFPPSQHGIVVGICSSGMGLGPFLAPLFVEWLSEHYSWRGALIIQAGINLNIVVCGMTLIDRQDRTFDQNYLRYDLFKDPYFINVILASLFSALGLSVIFVHLGYGVETFLNVGTFESSIVLTSCGMGSFIGRLAHGFISTSPRVNIIYQYVISIGLMGIMTALVPSCRSLILMIIVSTVIGLMVGAFGTVPGVVLVRIIEPAARTSAFGYQQFFLGLGLVVGAPLAGLLFDLTGNYAMSLYMGAVMLFSAVAVKLMAVRWWKHHLSRMRDIVNVEPGDGDPDAASLGDSLILHEEYMYMSVV